MHSEMSERQREHAEHVGSFGVSACQREPKVRFVTTPKEDVTHVEVCGDVVRVPKKIREGTLDNSHGSTISELVQI